MTDESIPAELRLRRFFGESPSPDRVRSKINELPQKSAAKWRNSNKLTLPRFLWSEKLETVLIAMRFIVSWQSMVYFFKYGFFDARMGNQSYTILMTAHLLISAMDQISRPGFYYPASDAVLFWENYGQYIPYYFVFLLVKPSSIALVPVCLLSVLNVRDFVERAVGGVGAATDYEKPRSDDTSSRQRGVVRISQLMEVLTMPVTLYMVVKTRSWFFVPFLYFAFLKYRLWFRASENYIQ